MIATKANVNLWKAFISSPQFKRPQVGLSISLRRIWVGRNEISPLLVTCLVGQVAYNHKRHVLQLVHFRGRLLLPCDLFIQLYHGWAAFQNLAWYSSSVICCRFGGPMRQSSNGANRILCNKCSSVGLTCHVSGASVVPCAAGQLAPAYKDPLHLCPSPNAHSTWDEQAH